jgi:hypothetical protein
VGRTWRLAGAFDSGHIRGWSPDWQRELNFHQLELTGHAAQLEEDYRLLREEFGLACFRDGAWLARTCPAPGMFNFSYLDRMASVSQGQIVLSLCHYEWLPWLTKADIWSGAVAHLMADLAHRVAQRYRGCFAGYIPVVESGYWTAMIAHWSRWWPSTPQEPAAGWWPLYALIGRMQIAMACAIREVDPDTPIAMSEPWNWDAELPLADQARPFNTLLGQPDPIAVRETGRAVWGGHLSFLDAVGLNFYLDGGSEQGWPLARLLLEARRQFPAQRLLVGETSNCRCDERHSVASWLRHIDEQVECANAGGARIDMVTWAPVITVGDFDWGHPAPGAWVTWDPHDLRRRRSWDPEVAAVIRSYTGGMIDNEQRQAGPAGRAAR